MLASFRGAELARVRDIDGFVLACLIDPSTGAVLASLQDQEGLDMPVVVAGTSDVADTLALMTARLATEDDLEDVLITLTHHYLLVRSIEVPPGTRFLLLVSLDRQRANLAMAYRELRDLSFSLP